MSWIDIQVFTTAADRQSTGHLPCIVLIFITYNNIRLRRVDRSGRQGYSLHWSSGIMPVGAMNDAYSIPKVNRFILCR